MDTLPASFKFYFDGLSDAHKTIFMRWCSFIVEKYPLLKTKMAYGLPSFTHKGRYIIHIGVQKSHVGLYPGSQAIEHFQTNLSIYETSKGTIKIPLDDEVPHALLTKIIEFNIGLADKKTVR